jgi:hypothetical protein
LVKIALIACGLEAAILAASWFAGRVSPDGKIAELLVYSQLPSIEACNLASDFLMDSRAAQSARTAVCMSAASAAGLMLLIPAAGLIYAAAIYFSRAERVRRGG